MMQFHVFQCSQYVYMLLTPRILQDGHDDVLQLAQVVTAILQGSKAAAAAASAALAAALAAASACF